MMPQRIQLKRTKGWKMPENTVKVDRTTKWGNPFTPNMLCISKSRDYEQGKPIGVEGAIKAYKTMILKKLKENPDFLNELQNKNLACWCKEGSACHGDILLKLANV